MVAGCKDNPMLHTHVLVLGETGMLTTWLAEGKPAHLVQKAMGHSDLRTTLHYKHLVRDDPRQLVEDSERKELKELAR